MVDAARPLFTAPAAWYVEPELLGRERTAIFARTWQLFGHESEFETAGDWRAENLAGYPLVVVRDEAGGLNGFHDVCRHRAGPLTQGPKGRCDGALVCRYHGWRYALDGRLRQARDFGPAPDFDPREFSLHPVRVETWRGLVFVNLDLDAAPLNALVAPLERRLQGRDWSGLKVGLTRSHRLACNWKTYVENYLEGYHVPSIHPGLDAEIDSARYSVTMDGHAALHEAPLRKPDPVYEGLWAWLWPNTGVNVYGEGLMVERMLPDGSHAMRLDYIYLTPGGAPVAAETVAMSDAVIAEDAWAVERVQQNLAAGVYARGRLSPRHELAIAAFQAWVGEALAAEPANAALPAPPAQVSGA